MARARRDVETILRVARMRYDMRMTPAEIAADLGVSEATVSRTLKAAMDMGFVAFQITPSGWRDRGLEEAMARRFGLSLAVVVHPTEGAETLSRALAAEIEDRLVPGTVIGVSDGETVAAVAAAMRRGRSQDVDVVALIGGLGSPQVSTYSTEIGRRLSAHVGGRAWQLPAPAVVESADAAEALFGMGLVRSVFEKMQLVSIALVGIGAMTAQAAVFRHGMIDAADIETIIRQGAVGSICARFYDAAGRPIRSEFDDRTIAVSLPELSAMRLRIGAAAGEHKVSAIRAALDGGLVNALATDTLTASALLSG